MLSQVLNNQNNSSVMPLSVTNSTLGLSLLSSTVVEPHNISNVVLALRTLGNFNFEG